MKNILFAVLSLMAHAAAAADVLYPVDDTTTSASKTWSSAQIVANTGVVNVKSYGAVGDGVTDDTAAIQDAIDVVGDAGGGVVFFPEGTYIVSNSNPSAVNWNGKRAIWINQDDICLVGAGMGATIIKQKSSSVGNDAHLIAIGARAPETPVVVDHPCIKDMSLDGNRDGQTDADGKGPDDGSAADTNVLKHNVIDVSSGSQNGILENLDVYGGTYYGIGGQRNNLSGWKIENVFIHNTGADGVDWKNDLNNNHTNVFNKIWIWDYGKKLFLAGTDGSQTGIDLRPGVNASHIYVEMPVRANTDLVGIRLQAPAGVELDTDPLSLPNSSSTMTITYPNHGLKVGDRITLAGATDFAGVTAATYINKSHAVVTVPTVNTLTVTLGTTSTSAASGGGSSVTMTKALPTQYASVDHWVVRGAGIGANGTGTAIAFKGGYDKSPVSNGLAISADYGMYNTYNDMIATNNVLYTNDVGIMLTTSGSDVASTGKYTGNVIRGNTTAGVRLTTGATENTFSANDIRSNGTYGADVQSGASNTRFLGGSISSNTTNLNNGATSTIVKNVSGFRTKNVVTTNVAIDSTGDKSFSIAHGLAVTPNVKDVTFTLKRNTAKTIETFDPIVLTSVDATNINGVLPVTVASTTGGATITVQATVNALDTP